MKKTHIIGLILVAIAIGIILITTGDASTYVGFDEAINDPQCIKRIKEKKMTKTIIIYHFVFSGKKCIHTGELP